MKFYAFEHNGQLIVVAGTDYKAFDAFDNVVPEAKLLDYFDRMCDIELAAFQDNVWAMPMETDEEILDTYGIELVGIDTASIRHGAMVDLRNNKFFNGHENRTIMEIAGLHIDDPWKKEKGESEYSSSHAPQGVTGQSFDPNAGGQTDHLFESDEPQGLVSLDDLLEDDGQSEADEMKEGSESTDIEETKERLKKLSSMINVDENGKVSLNMHLLKQNAELIEFETDDDVPPDLPNAKLAISWNHPKEGFITELHDVVWWGRAIIDAEDVIQRIYKDMKAYEYYNEQKHDRRYEPKIKVFMADTEDNESDLIYDELFETLFSAYERTEYINEQKVHEAQQKAIEELEAKRQAEQDADDAGVV